jgi:hypothetical protein
MVKQAHSLLDNLNQTVMQVSLPFPIYGMVGQTIDYANLNPNYAGFLSPSVWTYITEEIYSKHNNI